MTEYDEDYEVIDPELWATMESLYEREQAAQEAQGLEDAWVERSLQRIETLEEKLGRQLTAREIDRLGDTLKTDPDAELPVEDFKSVTQMGDWERIEHGAQVAEGFKSRAAQEREEEASPSSSARDDWNHDTEVGELA